MSLFDEIDKIVIEKKQRTEKKKEEKKEEAAKNKLSEVEFEFDIDETVVQKTREGIEKEVQKRPEPPVAIEKDVVDDKMDVADVPRVVAEEEVSEETVRERLHRKYEEVEVEFIVPEPSKYPKIVMTIYGEKGEGKTWLALTLPGSALLLDFDRQGLSVASQIRRLLNKTVYVVDCLKYMSYDYSEQPITGHKTYQYLKMSLDLAEKYSPDWVIFDNTEIYQEILEKAMRYVFGLEPYQGISNINVWKLRKAFMRELHYKALQVARKGVVYTCYPSIEEIRSGGEIIHSKKKPRWLDIVLYETNVLVHVRNENFRYIAVVESSKVPDFLKTGMTLDVTGEGFMKYLKKEV